MKPTKPKTGKAIMTDEEIIKDYCSNVFNDLTKEELLELMAQARQQGRVDGKKQENQRALKDGFDIGWKESEISLKAKLIKLFKENNRKCCNATLEQAIKEAERK